MKKILYVLFLLAELFVGALLMISLCSSMLYIPVVLVIVAVVGLLTWQILLLTKATDPAERGRILVRIPLILLIPIAAFVVTYVVIAALFIIAY